MSTPLGGGYIIFAFSGVRLSITLGFRSFQGKVFILSLPNLVWLFIGNSLHGIAFGEDRSIEN